MDVAGYEVLSRVAAGSTGVVWRGRHVELGRVVAIKELSPRLLAAPGFLERFRAEARTLAGLSDPHIVRVFDYVEDGAGAYLVQEWVDGVTLTELLGRHGSLSPEQAVGVLRGCLTGLAHAHARAVVHGDVSPGNVLVDAAGTSKVVDFGLAVPVGAAAALGSSGSGSVGTPAFASPEAVGGAPLTVASDVYSAGAVLFLLLTGRPPYVGDVGSVLAAHRSAAVPVLVGHGPELADLLRRSMAKDPGQRPRDAAVFLAELEEAAQRRYGAGWLTRASVAGLVGTVGAGTAATLAGSGAVAAAPTVVAAGQAVTGSVVAASTRVGPRIFGLPAVAASVAAVTAVAAIAVVAFVVTRPASSEPDEAAARGPVATASGQQAGQSSSNGTSDPVTTTPTPTPEPVPAFSGTYAVAVTLLAITGPVFDPTIGSVQNVVWTVTSACESGPCDATAVSSSGRTFDFVYADGTWSYTGRQSTVECVDGVTGAPLGEVAPSVIDTEFVPTTPVAADSTVAVAEFTGSSVETVPAPGCGSGASTYTSSFEAVRTGD